jgi:hypothetical protein
LSLGSGSNMRDFGSVKVFFKLLLAITAPGATYATSCHPQQYEDHLKYADWVFLGTVVEAGFSDPKSQ